MRMIKRLIRIVIIIFIVGFVLVCGLKRTFPELYMDSVERYAKDYGVDPLLVLAIIKTESNFDNEAVSQKGAKGLMQIMESTAQWIGSKMEMGYYDSNLLHNPDCNIKMGVWYLRWLSDKYNDIDLAIIAYNGGVGNVDRWLADSNYSNDGRSLSKIPFEETSNYLFKVKFAYKVYRFLYE